jgi:hypothetical protein
MTRYPATMVPCKSEHINYLASHMRQDEVEQWLAFSGDDVFVPRQWAATIDAFRGPRYTIMDSHGLPAAAGGYAYLSPGVWQSWMAGTMDGWEHHWRSITKAVRWLMEGMFHIGAQRLETYVIASRTRAIEWYTRSLGMTLKESLPNFANGRDAAIYMRAA